MDLKITVHEIDGDAEAADILTKPMPNPEPGCRTDDTIVYTVNV